MKTFVFIPATLLALSCLASSKPVALPEPDVEKHGKGPWAGKPFHFTSTYKVVATPDQVYNGTVKPPPGQPGAIGYYNFGINSELDYICYDITLYGVTGVYQSPVKTATHIHEAARAAPGPPRLAFPNPEGDDKVRRSVGCLTGPFTTGINGTNGLDTGTGFKVKQIEDNPAGFICDFHTKLYVPGVVRGQLGLRKEAP